MVRFPQSHIELYNDSKCCFDCALRKLKVKTTKMMKELPPGAWEKSVKEKMVLPLLKELSKFDPLKRMPIEWLDAEKHPERYPNTKCMIVVMYWEMCRMFKDGPSPNETIFFSKIQAMVYTIVDKIRTKNIPNEGYPKMLERMQIFDGIDLIHRKLNYYMRNNENGVLSIHTLIKYIRDRDAMDHAFLIIQRIDKKGEVLNGLRDALLSECENEKAKRRALQMALHPRSTNAKIRVLGSDLLSLCAIKKTSEHIVLWEEALGDYLLKL